MAADAIRRLGLNAAELLWLPLDQRIARVTEAIRQYAAASEQAVLFSQLFGDRAFVAFQRIDPAQLRQANDELRRFGVLVSDEDADRIEESNDAISRLGLIWRGLSNQLAVAAAPALQSAAEGPARLGEVGGPIQRVFTGLSDALVLLITISGGWRARRLSGAFAGFLAGCWVASLAAAALSARRLATALGLLKDVAAEAWDRIALRASAAWARVEAGSATAQAFIYGGLQGATEAVVGWAGSTGATITTSASNRPDMCPTASVARHAPAALAQRRDKLQANRFEMPSAGS